MSFFDEREELPPRRPGQRRDHGVDSQTARRRQIAALGVGAILLILVVLGIRGCASAREERAFKDYVRDAAADAQESRQESEAVYGLLRGGDQGAVDVQNSINGFRTEAARLVDRAKKRDRPDQLAAAHRYFVDALELRRDGIAAIARLLPTALGDAGRSTATRDIAAQMQTFLASDVIFTQRFLPRVYGAIRDEGLSNDVPIPEALRSPKPFLVNIDWLRPTTVADRIGRIRGGGSAQEPATPGVHGTGLAAVTVQPSGTALNAGGAVDIPARRGLTFDVQVQNQGESEERDVTVRLTISGAGNPITVEDSIDAVAAGEAQTASLPLPRLPATGRPVTIRVQIEAVPGEEMTENNRASYQAVFTR